MPWAAGFRKSTYTQNRVWRINGRQRERKAEKVRKRPIRSQTCLYHGGNQPTHLIGKMTSCHLRAILNKYSRFSWCSLRLASHLRAKPYTFLMSSSLSGVIEQQAPIYCFNLYRQIVKTLTDRQRLDGPKWKTKSSYELIPMERKKDE